MTTAMIGTITNSRADNCRLVRSAMITPPMAVSGAEIRMVSPTRTSI